jgi:hypothetical protein
MEEAIGARLGAEDAGMEEVRSGGCWDGGGERCEVRSRGSGMEEVRGVR